MRGKSKDPLLELAQLPLFSKGKHTSSGLKLFVGSRPQKPIKVPLKHIEKLPAVKLTEDFKCLEGWMVKNVLWEGVSVSTVVEEWEKKLNCRASYFLFGSGDFTCQLSRREALRKNTILAMRMHGRRLTPAHGGPLRLVFQGHKCYESVKALDRIVMLAKPEKTSARLIATSRIRKASQKERKTKRRGNLLN